MIKELNSPSEYNEFISQGTCLIYLSHDNCNVCKSLRPKINQLITEELTEVKLLFVDTEKFIRIAADNKVFSVPSILFLIDGKEYFRYSRNISLLELKAKIQRLLALNN